MLVYKHFSSREEWLEGRRKIKGLGGSEAAIVCGLSKWSTPVKLWEEKTGKRQPKDLSGVGYIQLGQRVEGPLRELFAALHPEFKVEHRPYDILYQEERPWLFATLDGELTEKATGAKGALEIKKFEIQSKADWETWRDKVPAYYFSQVLHQMLASGFEFIYLYALLIAPGGTGSLRTYYFPRKEYADDLDWLLKQEEKFMDNVRRNKIPALPLRI